MSNRKYPQTSWLKERATRRYPPRGFRRCQACKEIFKPESRIWKREIQVNWFRGDDDVEWYCIYCAPSQQVKDRTESERTGG